ncbi:MAG: InlB B-repeat-containing protein, partial [Desulfuromonadaceae bacterium]
SWIGETQAYGQQKVYRFRVPAGLTSIEVRLKNRVGNPSMTLRQDAAGSGLIPTPIYATYRADEGGRSQIGYNDTLITLAQPVAGDYTVVVSNQSIWVNGVGTTYPDAGYDLEVRALTPTPLAITGSSAASGSLVDQQVAYYQVEVPAEVSGQPVLGWLLKSAVSSGAVSIRVRKDLVPGGTNAGSVVSPNSAITIVPPVLTPGTWYVEVKGTGITDYTLSSDIVTADPAKHRRSWTMPSKIGSFTQAGLSAPYFGDSGFDNLGNPIINPDTLDQGTDLAKGEWHFYRVTVPVDNSTLLRTVVEALSGTPQLYLRAGNVPGIDHYANPANPTQGPTLSYERSQTLTGTMYGNWVPLNGKTATKLESGDWWIGVRAVTTNIRYRLKVAAGDVHDAGGVRLDSVGYVQDLAQNGGIRTGQNLAAEDMRYYRVQVPQSSDVPANSTPLSWSLTLAQQVGDVVIFVRDTIPPGQGTNGNAGSAIGNSAAASTYFQDWYDDHNNQNPDPYIVIDVSGVTTLTLPPVEPGKTYYLGVYARTDATFDLSSTVGASNLAVTAVLPFTSGTDSRTLAAGEQALYRIDVPTDAVLWHHNSTNAAGIQLYLAQSTVPPENSYAHWRSNSAVNTTLNQSLTAFPWQPGHSYYLLVKNTTAGALPFSIVMDGRTAFSALNVTLSGNGSGTITSSPNLITCSSGTCTEQITPYTAITLYRSPLPGSTFTGWSGDCSGTGNCLLSMTGPHSVTATFTLNSYTVSTSRSGTGSGSISSTPAGIDCRVGGTCSSGFLYGTSVTLTATPDPGNTFTGWSGTTCSGTGLCTFTVDGNKSATATFAPLRHLTIAFSGSGSGTVTSINHAGISCMTGSSTDCSYDYPNGAVVSLSAVTDWKSVFNSWAGTTSSSGTSATVTMDAARTVTAAFGAAPNARIGALDYPTFLAAYTAAPTGATILMKDIIFEEAVVINPVSPLSIYTLKGGFTDFSVTATGRSTIKGGLKIRNGKLIAERIIVK